MDIELIKSCPSCKLPTIKTHGCNLIRCICKTRWCWVCEKIKGNKFKGKENDRCRNKEHDSH